MRKQEKKIYGISSITAFLLGTAGLLSIIAFDMFYGGIGILAEGWPSISQDNLIRSIVIFISVLLIIWSVNGWHRQRLILSERNGLSIERTCVLVILICSVVFLYIFLVEPDYFCHMALEDHAVEWLSFVFLILSCISFIVSFVLYRKTTAASRFARWIPFLFAFIFFLIAMEEVSWFQRVLMIQTPEFMKGNIQHEFNFHNFFTDRIENVYYFSAFIFLVVFPFIRAVFHSILKDSPVMVFVPRPFIAVAGAFACAYNFDMWNIIFTQAAFYGAVIILFYYALFFADWKDKIITLFAVLITVIAQVCFLLNGKNFSRIWDVTEYKELLIPMAFFVYAVDVYRAIANGKKINQIQ